MLSKEEIKIGDDFVLALDKIRPSVETPNEVADALGLPREGMKTVQTAYSLAIVLDVKGGGLGFEGMKGLFLLGLQLGIAYGERLSKRHD